jgi:fructokinase
VYRILGIGELLWDMLPQGPQLGGAPANYSVMAARLGNDAALVSRIGQDKLGDRALEVLSGFPVERGLLQRDEHQPTGQVTVKFEEGQPAYVIHQPVAWDFFELTDLWISAAAEADAVCFGSLAQRSEQSRQAIYAQVQATKPSCLRIFDVNLRSPFYTAEILRNSLRLASVAKLNDVELPLVLEILGFALPDQPRTVQLRRGAERLLAEFPQLKLVAMTCGGDGSLLVAPQEWHSHAGIPTRVMDTIGAGDAFTAALTHYLLQGAPLNVLNEAGNRWGSYIASQVGAMPPIDPQDFRRIEQEIEAVWKSGPKE